MKIAPQETAISGRLTLDEHRAWILDRNCIRIQELISSYLLPVSTTRPGDWDWLYRDPHDGRLWEVYPPIGWPGGGPPMSLRVLSEQEANAKYMQPTGSASIGPEETEIGGHWDHEDERIWIADQNPCRVQDLITYQLIRIAVSQSGWEFLHKDPSDGRLWELWFPQSYLHGGGPKALRVLSKEQALAKYGKFEKH